MYSALMIDLKKSREYSLKNRESIQQYIFQACGVLNKLFPCVREVEFSAGDEIQGLFSTPAEAYLYFRLFAMLVHPVKFRAGIGVGTWDIKIDNAGSPAQDGEVYYRARQAISEADELEGYPVLYCSGKKIDTVINSLIGGAAGMGERMNSYQNELMLLTEMLSPLDANQKLDIGSMSEIKELIAYKSEIDFYKADRKANKKYPFDSSLGDDLLDSTFRVDVAETEDTFYITSGRQRGLPSKLAGIMGISRQSVEKTLKTSNIFVARNMSISALKVMPETKDK
ncbi:MAG: hypothetical protein E7456_07415 [Ruminococcaceae bacterium]|nr:hypothetical protein [Oscillospiraceae bacterium]